MLITTVSDCRTLKGESAFDLRGGGHARIEIKPPMAEWCNGSISESLSDDPSSSLGAAIRAVISRQTVTSVITDFLTLNYHWHL